MRDALYPEARGEMHLQSGGHIYIRPARELEKTGDRSPKLRKYRQTTAIEICQGAVGLEKAGMRL